MVNFNFNFFDNFDILDLNIPKMRKYKSITRDIKILIFINLKKLLEIMRKTEQK